MTDTLKDVKSTEKTEKVLEKALSGVGQIGDSITTMAGKKPADAKAPFDGRAAACEKFASNVNELFARIWEDRTESLEVTEATNKSDVAPAA